MNYKVLSSIYGSVLMENRNKLVCPNRISIRQLVKAETGVQSMVKFATAILSKYRLRRNLRQFPNFIFRQSFQPMNPGQEMANQSLYNTYLRIQLHFQGHFNYKTNQFLVTKVDSNGKAGTFGASRKFPEGFRNHEPESPKLTTVTRDRILVNRFTEDQYFHQPLGRSGGLQRVLFIPDDLPSRGRSNPGTSTQEPVSNFHLTTMDHPRPLPVREILGSKLYFHSSQSVSGPRVESLKAVQAGGKKRILHFAIPAMQIPKIAVAKSNQAEHTVVLSTVRNTASAKPPSKDSPASLREQYIYRTVPGKVSENHSEFISGVKMGLSGTIRRTKGAFSNHEFVWRKPADAPSGQKRTTVSTGAAQTNETVSTVTTLSGSYPAARESKEIKTEINTIVSAVLKNLDKRIAIERDKRGRR